MKKHVPKSDQKQHPAHGQNPTLLNTPDDEPSTPEKTSPKDAPLSPMFEQYMGIKADYPDALLFYRMGDFYELFFEDAEVAARELQIALTSRNPNAEKPIPMCGVPWHAAENYVSQLVNKGYKVVFCDQIQDPKEAKGLVERAVTRVHTAGTVLEDASLDAKGRSYLGAIYIGQESSGFAWVDVSTGHFSGFESKKSIEVWQWAQKLAPRELLVPDQLAVPNSVFFDATQLVSVPSRSHFMYDASVRRLLTVQGVQDLGALGLEGQKSLVVACGALLTYIEHAHLHDATHLAPFVPIDMGKHLIIDEITERNLELFRRFDGKKGVGTLKAVLDETMTPMGGRLLEDRLRQPWRELAPIHDTQAAIGYFVERHGVRDTLRGALLHVYDLERLSTRIVLNRANPRDFLALRHSLLALVPVRNALDKPSFEGAYPTADEVQTDNLPNLLRHVLQTWDDMSDTADLLQRALRDTLPPTLTEGALFKQGYADNLDELIDLVEHGENRVQALLEAEQSQHNLSKLRVGYNRVFGYYFELSRLALASVTVPEHFIRRQSLANAERFVTPELKELEEKLLAASQARKTLEYKMFQELREQVAAARVRLVFMADIIANLDVWQSLACVAAKNNWVCPDVTADRALSIREGRHPVVEAIVGTAGFVPNDITMDSQRWLLLITGPNMSGKSTVLRQVALLTILAQMGSFVPAREAHIGLCDRVFSRVGASDNLAQGQSTFMVEMMETARILRQATKHSLVILDEIGRGTSTFDGLALAWAVAEYLVQRAGGHIRTLFATHYLELAALEGQLPGIHTMNIAIREWQGDIVFLRRLLPGPADKSYGVEVAKLAGVPDVVVQRARVILAELERTRPKQLPIRALSVLLPGMESQNVAPTQGKTSAPLPSLTAPVAALPVSHPLLIALQDTDPEKLTPLEALQRIIEWKTQWGDSREKS